MHWITYSRSRTARQVAGFRNVLVVHVHDNDRLCVKSYPTYMAPLGNGAHLLDAMLDQRFGLSMVSQVIYQRGLERGGAVDDQNTTRDRSTAIAMHMVMMSLEVAFPVLDRLSMLGHHGFEFDRDLDGRRSGAEDLSPWNVYRTGDDSLIVGGG